MNCGDGVFGDYFWGEHIHCILPNSAAGSGGHSFSRSAPLAAAGAPGPIKPGGRN
jgi:hypothetical protein